MCRVLRNVVTIVVAALLAAGCVGSPSSAAASPFVDSDAASPAVQRAAFEATWLCQTNGGSGTAVSIHCRELDTGEVDVFLATAEHVVDDGGPIRVSRATVGGSYAESLDVTVVARNAAADLAILVGRCDHAVPCIRVCPPRIAPRGDRFPALAIGAGGGRFPVTHAEVVEPSVTHGSVRGRLFNTELIEPIPGRSGGPLVSLDLDVSYGRLLGVCTRGSGNGTDGYYTDVYTLVDLMDEAGIGDAAREVQCTDRGDGMIVVGVHVFCAVVIAFLGKIE